MLYGGSPMPELHSAEKLGLKPGNDSRAARSSASRSIEAGDAVGYGGTFVADGAMRVGVVACGYADGYPRHAPTGTPDSGKRAAYADAGAGVDGHAGLRPDPPARSRRGRRPSPYGAMACPPTRWPPPPAPSATSCSAPWRAAVPRANPRARI